MKSLLTLVLAGLGFGAAQAHAEAVELYRFVNEDGIVVLSNSIPPELVSRGYDVVRGDGTLVRVVPRELTPTEVAERERQLAQEKAAAARRHGSRESRRRSDEALCVTARRRRGARSKNPVDRNRCRDDEGESRAIEAAEAAPRGAGREPWNAKERRCRRNCCRTYRSWKRRSRKKSARLRRVSSRNNASAISSRSISSESGSSTAWRRRAPRTTAAGSDQRHRD